MEGRILLVDDEARLREFVSLFLHAEGFEVIQAENGREAVAEFTRRLPDLVLLDINLPDTDGFAVCKALRGVSENVPVIFLTAMDDDDYQLAGYAAGGDDYITKPVKASILLAKVRRMITRSVLRHESSVVAVKGLMIDEGSRTVSVDGVPVILAPKEFELLVFLVKCSGRVVSREELLVKIWGFQFEGGSRVVDNHITKLRRKLGPYSDMIKTVFTVGYRFEP